MSDRNLQNYPIQTKSNNHLIHKINKIYFMATFIVRVQLDNGTMQDYTKLKNLLLHVGFTKKIINKEGFPYILPLGNYLGESDKDKFEVLTIVQRQVEKVRKRYQILVTESVRAGSAWAGLSQA